MQITSKNGISWQVGQHPFAQVFFEGLSASFLVEQLAKITDSTTVEGNLVD